MLPCPTYFLLPILGNPNGRVFQALAPDENIPNTLYTLLCRYGDLVPRAGNAELYSDGKLSANYPYHQNKSQGYWVIGPIEEIV